MKYIQQCTIVTAVLLILSACSSQQSDIVEDTTIIPQADEVVVNSTLAALLSAGKSTTCSFESMTTAPIRGVVWLDGPNEAIAAEFEQLELGTSFMTYTIVKEDTQYVWGTYFEEGISMQKENNIVLNTMSNDQNPFALTDEDIVEFNCTDWVVDLNVFELPTDVSFIDTNTEIETDSGNGTCADCDVLQDPADKSACQEIANC